MKKYSKLTSLCFILTLNASCSYYQLVKDNTPTITFNTSTTSSSNSEITLEEGKELDLTNNLNFNGSKVKPDELLWVSKNTDVATIEYNTGKVKTIKEGSTLITITIKNKPNLFSVVKLNVTKKQTVTKIKITPSTSTIAIGQQLQLKASVQLANGEINSNIQWSSSDNTIVGINPNTGILNAIKEGEVTIKATYTLDNTYIGIAKITIVSDVSKIPPSATPSLNVIPEKPLVSAPSSIPTITIDPSLSPQSSYPIVSTIASSKYLHDNDNAQFMGAEGLTIDSTGNLYIADINNNLIRKITPNGIISTIAGRTTQGYADGQGKDAQFHSPSGLTIDNDGNLYVSDSGNDRIRKITPSGMVSTIAGIYNMGYIDGEAYADGQSTKARFFGPSGITIDSTGNLYVADSGNYRIRKITPSGMVSTIAGSSQGYTDGDATDAQFSVPSGITIDSIGNLYVADNGNNNLIRKITPSGMVSTIAGSTTSGYTDGQGINAKFSNPEGITIDSIGNLYVTDTGNNLIRKITPSGMVSTIAGSRNINSEGYIEGGFVDGSANKAQFSGPRGITIDSAGNIYVADRLNNRIRKITF